MPDFSFAEWDPTISDIYRREIVVDGISCSVSLLEEAPSDDFGYRRNQCINASHGVLGLYSPTSEISYLNVTDESLDIVRRVRTQPMVEAIIATKRDLCEQHDSERMVTTEQGKQLAASKGNLMFFEISNKIPSEVENVIHEMVREIRRRPEVNPVRSPPKSTRGGCEVM